MTQGKSDDDTVRLAVYMTRRQRKDFHKMAKDLDVSASDYILQPALDRLMADQAKQREEEQDEPSDG